MTKVLVIGRAVWGSEALDFRIGYWAHGIGLMMRRSSREEAISTASAMTGAGIWPTIEKAKGIAEETVQRLLGPECPITWEPISY